MQDVYGVVALVISNALWAFVYWRREATIQDLGKLLASRTLAEYSWLKSAESGRRPPEPPEEKEGSYENLWENEQNVP